MLCITMKSTSKILLPTLLRTAAFMKELTSKSIKNWLQTLLETWRIANNSNVWAHCASVGFFGFLSIFPVMAVFVLLYGLAFSPAEMQEQISLLSQFIPDTVYEVLNSRLSELVSTTTSALTFSLLISSLLALYAGSKGIKSLIIRWCIKKYAD